MATDTPAIGIDLGTTYSCVAVFYHSKVEVIANVQGNRTTPSYVAFVDSERFIGETAKSQLATNPGNTVFDAKRLIGRHFDDAFLQLDMQQLPFEVLNDGGSPKIKVEYQGGFRTFCPEEISSMILARMKETAESFLEQAVTKAVITVPAYFNDSQRQATKDAGVIAGLDVLRIINEPTAAAIGYGLERGIAGSPRDRNVLVFDLGGGTFDVSLLTIKDGEFKVKSTSGDAHLGGEDFDSRMVDHFVQEFKRQHDQDLTTSKRSLSRLRSACEVAKRVLSCDCKAMLNIDCLFEGRDFTATITRAKFENLNADLFQNTLESVQRALTDAGMDKCEVDDVVLIGGSTRIPKIQKLLKDFFGGKALHADINPDEAVACGAAIHAAMLNGDQSELVRDLRLLDVTPLSLGIRLHGGAMSVVIERNTPLPARETLQNLTTVVDNQKAMRIAVCEGERAIAANNNLLGEFLFSGFQVAARDVPRITVAFHINEDGILKVSAEDHKTGSQKEITINKGRLSKEEIGRMVREAKQFKADDDRQKARISARNALEDSVYRIQSSLGGIGEEISEDDRSELVNMVNDAFEWLDSHKQADADDFKSENQRLVAEVEELLPLHYLKII